MITLVDDTGRITYSSPATARILGYEPAELIGMHFVHLLHPEEVERGLRRIDELVTGGGESGANNAWRSGPKDGAIRWVESQSVNALQDRDVQAFIVNWRDVTDRHELQERLRHEALHDPLTALPNRRMFTEHLSLALARLARTSGCLAGLFCDIDHFNYINDTFGNAAGNEALRQVAERLQPVLRPADSVARIGGDKFLMLCEGLDSPLDVGPIAARIHGALTGDYRIADTDVRITFSIGVTTTDVPRDADLVIAEADSALYQVKRSGRNRFDTFDRHVRRLVTQPINLEHALSEALTADRLALAYQPVVALPSASSVARRPCCAGSGPPRRCWQPKS